MDTEVSEALQVARGMPECRETADRKGDRKTNTYPQKTRKREKGSEGGRKGGREREKRERETGRGRQRRKKLRARDRERGRVGMADTDRVRGTETGRYTERDYKGMVASPPSPSTKPH